LIDFTEGYPEALTIATAYASAYVLGSALTIGAHGSPAGLVKAAPAGVQAVCDDGYAKASVGERRAARNAG
jgi:hypothetical protein